MYDIVYPLKEQNKNIDLLYSLRSLAKFGGEIGNVWIVGHLPDWITNVNYIPTIQNKGKHENTRENLNAVCHCDEISEDFILFNDDFILSEPVTDWNALTNSYNGTLKERYDNFRATMPASPWRDGHGFNHDLLRKLGVENPLCFEFHGPMLMNRRNRLEMLEKPEIKKYLTKNSPMIFQRSLYGNLYPRENPTKIRDIKLLADAFNKSELTEHGYFSVNDDIIGNYARCPHLNGWLEHNLGEKCRFER